MLAAGSGGVLAAAESAGVAKAGVNGGLEQPAFYRFKIGAFDAIAFNDGAFSSPVAQSPFGVGEPVEAKVAVLREAYLPLDTINLQFNVLLVRMGAEWVLFDAGCGAAFGAAGGRLIAQMAAAGVKPEQVTVVMVSHAHGDHIGGLLDATTGAAVFRNATHFIGRREYEFWTGVNPDLSKLPLGVEAVKEQIAGAQNVLGVLKAKWQLIAPGEKIIGGLEIVDAPGHTAGHLAFVVGSGGAQLLHFVDAAHHHALSFAHPEWAFGYDAEPERAGATRRRLLDRAAADRVRVFGAHMPFPALGHVKALEGGRYEYVIAPWVVG